MYCLAVTKGFAEMSFLVQEGTTYEHSTAVKPVHFSLLKWVPTLLGRGFAEKCVEAQCFFKN